MGDRGTITRERIIEVLADGLEPHDRVLAMHLGGSDASGRVDERSDIDAVATVEDDAVEDVFDRVRALLESLSPLEAYHRLPDPTWHGHSQCFYALRDAPPTAMVDLVVMKRSAPDRMLDEERHGRPAVLFDKLGLIVPTSLDSETHAARMRARLDAIESSFALFRPLVMKALDRGHVAEAVHFYMVFSFRPLVDITRIAHCPERFDFGPRYLDRDVPPEARADLERLAFAADAETLRHHHEDIGRLFEQTLPRARAATDDIAQRSITHRTRE